MEGRRGNEKRKEGGKGGRRREGEGTRREVREGEGRKETGSYQKSQVLHPTTNIQQAIYSWIPFVTGWAVGVSHNPDFRFGVKVGHSAQFRFA